MGSQLIINSCFLFKLRFKHAFLSILVTKSKLISFLQKKIFKFFLPQPSNREQLPQLLQTRRSRGGRCHPDLTCAVPGSPTELPYPMGPVHFMATQEDSLQNCCFYLPAPTACLPARLARSCLFVV